MTLKEKLSGKRILLLSVQTFNYERIIANQLRKVGAVVDYYDERPTNSLFAKGIIRLKRSLYQTRIDNYYKKILANASEKRYDFLLVIRGEVVPEFFLKEFRIQQSTCEFIFYTWDSFTNHTHPVTIQKYFDKRFTFDSNDAKKHDLFFRPLFYVDDYKELNTNSSHKKAKYNLLFLGTAHSDRYKISSTIVKWCDEHNLTSFTYYYMHGRLVFLFKRWFDKSFKAFDYRKLSFNSLTLPEIINLYKESQVILDINHPGQNGLTMRTFEALGAGKKIITTNPEIRNYPFYDVNNIMIIDRNDPKLNLDFFKSDFAPIEDDLLNDMSIDGWLHSIFVINKPNFWLNGYK